MMTTSCMMLIHDVLFAIHYVTVDRPGFPFLEKWKKMYYNGLFLYLPERGTYCTGPQ